MLSVLNSSALLRRFLMSTHNIRFNAEIRFFYQDATYLEPWNDYLVHLNSGMQ